MTNTFWNLLIDGALCCWLCWCSLSIRVCLGRLIWYNNSRVHYRSGFSFLKMYSCVSGSGNFSTGLFRIGSNIESTSDRWTFIHFVSVSHMPFGTPAQMSHEFFNSNKAGSDDLFLCCHRLFGGYVIYFCSYYNQIHPQPWFGLPFMCLFSVYISKIIIWLRSNDLENIAESSNGSWIVSLTINHDSSVLKINTLLHI